MDSLVSMSDQLAKMDPSIEIVVRKLARFIYDILSPDERVRVKLNCYLTSYNVYAGNACTQCFPQD